MVKKQRLVKETTVADLSKKLASVSLAVLTDYRGLNVAEVTQLRNKLREAGIDYKVVKNTLTRLAAREVGINGLEQYLEGPTAIAFGTDPVAPARILTEYAKGHKNLEIKAGVLQGKVINAGGVKTLADLPSREQLLAKVAGGMQAPISGLVNVLAGPLRNVVYALDRVREQKEKASA